MLRRKQKSVTELHQMKELVVMVEIKVERWLRWHSQVPKTFAKGPDKQTGLICTEIYERGTPNLRILNENSYKGFERLCCWWKEWGMKGSITPTHLIWLAKIIIITEDRSEISHSLYLRHHYQKSNRDKKWSLQEGTMLNWTVKREFSDISPVAFYLITTNKISFQEILGMPVIVITVYYINTWKRESRYLAKLFLR